MPYGCPPPPCFNPYMMPCCDPCRQPPMKPPTDVLFSGPVDVATVGTDDTTTGAIVHTTSHNRLGIVTLTIVKPAVTTAGDFEVGIFKDGSATPVITYKQTLPISATAGSDTFTFQGKLTDPGVYTVKVKSAISAVTVKDLRFSVV